MRATRATVLAMLATTLVCALRAGATSAAAPTATLRARLLPEHLGKGTTIKFALSIAPPAGEFPPAPVTIDLRYPANLGIATSGLGTSDCAVALLEADGPPGCPSNSVMGYGSGTVEVSFGTEVLEEHTRATVFMAPLHEAHFSLLLYAEGEAPVAAQIVLPATILAADGPFGGDLATTLPLIPSVPDAPDVALVKLTLTLGPDGVTYFEYARHRRLPYHPIGILLPPRCPRGGFPFDVQIAFQDGTHAESSTSVPCPRSRR